MRLVFVTGSRGWTDYQAIRVKLTEAQPDHVIHGGAPGADQHAQKACHDLGIPHTAILAQWRTHGGCRCRDQSPDSTCRFAGIRRNRQMLDAEPELVLGFWIPPSPGTKDCLEEARRRGIAVDVTLG